MATLKWELRSINHGHDTEKHTKDSIRVPYLLAQLQTWQINETFKLLGAKFGDKLASDQT